MITRVSIKELEPCRSLKRPDDATDQLHYKNIFGWHKGNDPDNDSLWVLVAWDQKKHTGLGVRIPKSDTLCACWVWNLEGKDFRG